MIRLFDDTDRINIEKGIVQGDPLSITKPLCSMSSKYLKKTQQIDKEKKKKNIYDLLTSFLYLEAETNLQEALIGLN